MEKLKLVLIALLSALCVTAQAQDEEIYLVPVPQPRAVIVVPSAIVAPSATVLPLRERQPIRMTIQNDSNFDISMVSRGYDNVNEKDVHALEAQTLYAHSTHQFLIGREGYPAHLSLGFAISPTETQRLDRIIAQWEYIEDENLADSCHNYGARTERQTTVSYVPAETYAYPYENPLYPYPGYTPYYYSPYPNYAPVATYAYPPPEVGYTAVPVYTNSTPFSVRCSGDNSIITPIVQLELEHV